MESTAGRDGEDEVATEGSGSDMVDWTMSALVEGSVFREDTGKDNRIEQEVKEKTEIM